MSSSLSSLGTPTFPPATFQSIVPVRLGAQFLCPLHRSGKHSRSPPISERTCPRLLRIKYWAAGFVWPPVRCGDCEPCLNLCQVGSLVGKRAQPLPMGRAILIKIVPLFPYQIFHPAHEWGHYAPVDTALRLPFGSHGPLPGPGGGGSRAWPPRQARGTEEGKWGGWGPRGEGTVPR